MTSLFENKAPLYEMAAHFELPALSIDEIESYVTQHLNIDTLLNKKLIDRDNDRFFLPDRTLELWVERL